MHTWNKEETMKKLQARFGNRTDSVIAAFTSAYPGRSHQRSTLHRYNVETACLEDSPLESRPAWGSCI